MSVYEPGWLEALGDMFSDPCPDNDVPFIRNRYRVACGDAAFVKAILNNAITSEMLSWSGGRRLDVRGNRLWLTHSAQFDAEEWPGIIQNAIAFVKLIPEEASAWTRS